MVAGKKTMARGTTVTVTMVAGELAIDMSQPMDLVALFGTTMRKQDSTVIKWLLMNPLTGQETEEKSTDIPGDSPFWTLVLLDFSAERVRWACSWILSHVSHVMGPGETDIAFGIRDFCERGLGFQYRKLL
jgi:hypothetical protein